MIKYQKITIPSFRADSIVCNKCGKQYHMDDWCVTNNFTTLESSYGYGSSKDGAHFLSHVCEPCLDEIYESFKIPPQELDEEAEEFSEDDSFTISALVAPGESSDEPQKEKTKES